MLREFLLKHRGEVTDLLLSQYDEEAYIKSEKEISFEDGYEDGYENGYEKCRNELLPIIDSQNKQIKNQDIQINKQNETIRLLSEQLQQLQKKFEAL